MSARAGVSALLLVAASACLPDDTRPPPSEVLVRFVGSKVVTDGFDTTDGWRVTFDQVLLSFGNPTLAGDACNQYADAGYRRIFDARVLEPQKVGLDYALGTCSVRARFGNPNGDSLLGVGVTDAQKVFLRTPGTDEYNTDPAGISAYLVGRGQKGAVTKRFTFAIRTRRLQLQDCAKSPGAEPSSLVLDGAPVTVDFHAHPEGPFRQHLDPTRPESWFAPFAAADDEGNADGEITLTELYAKKIETVTGLLPEDLVPKGLPKSPFTSFADYVWLGTSSKLATWGPDGPCQVPVSAPSRGGGGGLF